MTSEETYVMGTVTRRSLAAFGAILVAAIAFAVLASGSAQAGEITKFELERTSSLAGGHPDVSLTLNSTTKDTERQNAALGEQFNPCLCGDPKRIAFHLPTGFIGNPHAIPKCSLAELGLSKCPPDSQVGSSEILLGQQQVYNMEPRTGEPGLIAARIPIFGVPVFTIFRARTEDDYGLTAITPDIWHPLGLASLRIWIWGVPTDSSHDKNRAPLNLQGGLCFATYPDPCLPTPVAASSPPIPYLQNPTECAGPLTPSVDIEYYDHSTDHADTTWTPNTTCDLLGFSPSLAVDSTTGQADAPSGLDVNVTVPQTQSPTVPTPSQIRTVRLLLPEGFSINPNAADGKEACTDAAAAYGTSGPALCPENAKIGTLSITSTALPGPIHGALYLGEPKPGEPYRVVLAASGFETHVKLPGRVSLDPQTGRIETLFEDLPQTPLQELELHVFGAERGLLATPERCGEYTLESEFVPWAKVLGAQVTTTTFTIDSGPGGSPCPGQSRPLAPAVVAGSPDNTAGAFSPFAIKLDRDDGDQNLNRVNVTTPPGLLASLRGRPYCPESAIALLADPEHTGRDEQEIPACPAASLVGSTVTAAGAGSRPLSVPGKIYLAGPHNGASVSVVVVVPAVSGPYDLGNVVVRVANRVDPTTARITTISDPLPQILGGIPLRLRSVLVNLNQPGFTLNPTNCDPFSVDLTVFGDESGSASPSTHYQVANCNALGFGPKLAIRLRGSSKRRGNPAVRAVLTTNPGEANLRKAVVTMPKSLLLDNAHIGNICTRVQFAADSCPANSQIGTATADSPLLGYALSGPVFLRSSSNELPDLVVDLHGQVDIEAVGRIDTPKGRGLRVSFESIPDAPVTSVTLDLEGGSKGLLINSVNLCKARPSASVALTGQNGMTTSGRTRLQTSCGSKARRSKHPRLLRAEAVR